MILINVPPVTKRCKICKKIFTKSKYCGWPEWKRRKYCSTGCADRAKIGKPSWNKGIKIDRNKFPNFGHLQKHTPEALEKITEANKINAGKRTKEFYRENQKLAIRAGKERGSYKGTLGRKKNLSSVWKGDKANYNSKHRWIQKNWEKTGICENCGKQIKPFGKRKFGTEWHNLDGKYNREDRNTWLELCKKCHKRYDNT